MIRTVQRTWFEVWGTEQAQNRFLKALLVFFVTLCTTEATALVVLALRKPELIAVTPSETRVLAIVPPKPDLLEAEVRRTVSGYVAARHNWEWAKVDDGFGAAARFVEAGFVKKFLDATREQAKLAKEKKLSQRFHVADLKVDIKTKTARVQGDRILIVDGLRATNPMTVDVQFEYGARSETNPEGIYVIGEKLVTDVGIGAAQSGGQNG